ncbi:hypothetical protein HYPSUDRAFT_60344 [Hypholoma sublateritium FD-334 SS-4]|uniref:Uncharacterized protein n=1 Tax=Hypholoma sublateritium (strain FD-334 SS-4) TaxID=945553 RepID=A0A0D2N711_HYPSF|nr:hypothetical protein HYPSUDRAFT_60344 [Hypholoma sublateritium FD-334 SS-4]
MFSSVNFRALLDLFQGLIALFAGIGPPRPRPIQHLFPHSDGVASRDFRKELDAYEAVQKTAKEQRTGSSSWSQQEALEARMERTRQVIAMTNRQDITVFLQSDSAIQLLAEKHSFIRTWGNQSAHRVVEQGAILEDMVNQCAEYLESYEVSGLLHMIQALRPEWTQEYNSSEA